MVHLSKGHWRKGSQSAYFRQRVFAVNTGSLRVEKTLKVSLEGETVKKKNSKS
jgi:hypothetical protein